MMAGVGFLVWAWAFLRKHDEQDRLRRRNDPLLRVALTPSQRAPGKYLFLIMALFTLQVMLGALRRTTPWRAEVLWAGPVAVVPLRAGAHLAHPERAVLDRLGLSGCRPVPGAPDPWRQDPRYQKLGVDILFWALVVVVVGSFTGNYLTIAQIMPPEWNFWLSHQGYEYVDLGRLGRSANLPVWPSGWC